ncbi:hypothetical protein GJ496_011836 [Pomphorhynchus laevis]|nr:hypothetical protein GJ496_011836 [Pomphorhynchus laevis]
MIRLINCKNLTDCELRMLQSQNEIRQPVYHFDCSNFYTPRYSKQTYEFPCPYIKHFQNTSKSSRQHCNIYNSQNQKVNHYIDVGVKPNFRQSKPEFTNPNFDQNQRRGKKKKPKFRTDDGFNSRNQFSDKFRNVGEIGKNSLTLQLTRVQKGPNGQRQKVTVQQEFKDELELEHFLKVFEEKLKNRTCSPMKTRFDKNSNNFSNSHANGPSSFVIIEEPLDDESDKNYSTCNPDIELKQNPRIYKNEKHLKGKYSDQSYGSFNDVSEHCIKRKKSRKKCEEPVRVKKHQNEKQRQPFVSNRGKQSGLHDLCNDKFLKTSDYQIPMGDTINMGTAFLRSSKSTSHYNLYEHCRNSPISLINRCTTKVQPPGNRGRQPRFQNGPTEKENNLKHQRYKFGVSEVNDFVYLSANCNISNHQKPRTLLSMPKRNSCSTLFYQNNEIKCNPPSRANYGAKYFTMPCTRNTKKSDRFCANSTRYVPQAQLNNKFRIKSSWIY